MSLTALWIGLLGGPIAWLLYLQVSYTLAPSACIAGNKNVLAIATIIALIATLAITFVSWRAWHASGANSVTDEGGVLGRSRFMALSGLGISVLSVLLVVASAIPIIVLGACD
jgi:hypothetical protein